MKMLFKQRFFSWLDSYDIYDEAGNRLHAQKAVMSLLMGVPAPAAALEAAEAVAGRWHA